MDNNLKSIITNIATNNPKAEIVHVILKSAVHAKRKTVLRGRRSCN